MPARFHFCDLCRRVAFVSALMLALGSSQQVLAQAELSPELASYLAESHDQVRFRVFAVLKQQAHLKDWKQTQASKFTDSRSRRAAAITHLKSSNLSTQAQLLKNLQSNPDIKDISARWIVNLIGFEASSATIRQLATHPDIAGLVLEMPWESDVDTKMEAASSSSMVASEPGLRSINAQFMWRLGYTGFGTLALTADTGVDPYHPALNHKFAGHRQHRVPFFSPSAQGNPYDCGDHGTHVNGTIMGLDRSTNDTIGVAPDAHWLGGAILCGIGTSDNLAVFEWALDPENSTDTDADRPFVINNSWHDPSVYSIECSSSNPYPTLLDNLEDAGLAVVFSAGNAGPDDRSITAPHNHNARLLSAFSVAALEGGTRIASFSSRGPSLCFRDSLPLDIKPEVSAPGASVRSCVPGGGYARFSGTSMAAPHVSGAVLLLHEAFPDLDGADILMALYMTAKDMGEPGEDNTFGRGIIDLELAYNYLIDQGNTPTPPQRPALAPQVFAAEADPVQCDVRSRARVGIANTGSIRIDSVSYEFYINTSLQDIRTLVVDLEPGESRMFDIEMLNRRGSNHLSIRLIEADGESLHPGLDLGASFMIEQYENIVRPELTMVDSIGAVCEGSAVLLDIQGPFGDDLIPHFYTVSGSLPPVSEISRPAIVQVTDEETLLFGKAEYLTKMGFDVVATDNLSFIDPEEDWILLRSEYEARIRSATVIANSAGFATFALYDLGGVNLFDRARVRLVEGEQRIPLDLYLEPNRMYSLRYSTSLQLGVNTATADDFANTVPDFVEGAVISQDELQSSNSTPLFDIEFGYFDPCAELKVTVTPDTNRQAQPLELGLSADSVRVGESIVISEISSANLSQYRWLVDNSWVALDQPNYTYSPDSEHPMPVRIGVSAYNDEGCISYAETSVRVLPSVLSTRETADVGCGVIFPNPASSYFAMECSSQLMERIDLLDMFGRTVKSWQGYHSQYELSNVVPGGYIVRMYLRDGKSATMPLMVQP